MSRCWKETNKITDDLRFQIRFHAIASIGTMAFWMSNENREKPVIIADRLIKSMPQDLYRILPNLKQLHKTHENRTVSESLHIRKTVE